MTHKRDLTEQPRDPMFVQVGRFEAELGVPAGFLERLLNDGDDWSFVIKVHSLVEAALTHAITTTVARSELKEFFGALAIGDTKRGKLAVAHRLHLLDKRRIAFFRALGRIRNQFAHDVKHVGLRVEQSIALMPSNEHESVWRDLIQGYTIEPVIFEPDGSQKPASEFARTRPRFTVWVSAMSSLSLLYRAKELDDSARREMFLFLTELKPRLPPISGPRG